MKYSLSFVLRTDRLNSKGSCPIYLRYTFQRYWKNIPVRYSIEPVNWDKENSIVKKRYSEYNFLKKILNEFENNVRSKLDSYFLKNGTYPKVSELFSVINKNHKNDIKGKEVIKTLFEDFVNYKKSKSDRYNTIKNYRSTWNKWVLFEKKNKNIELNQLDDKTLNSFYDFLLSEGLQKSSIQKYIKVFKRFLDYLYDYRDIDIPKSYKRFRIEGIEERDFEVLTLEELEKLKSCVFYSHYIEKNKNKLDFDEREKLIGRVMIFLCSTGLSFVDFDRLTINDLYVDIDRLGSKKKYLNIKIDRKKLNTSNVCVIPILENTIDIIIETLGLTYEFYGGDEKGFELDVKVKILEKLIKKIKSGERFRDYQPRLFPKIQVQHFNKEIKKLLSKVGIDSKIKVIKYIKGNRVEEVLPKYEVITSHTGRRTYITNLLLMGVRPHILMKTTGHKKVGTLLRYNRETELNINNEIHSKVSNFYNNIE